MVSYQKALARQLWQCHCQLQLVPYRLPSAQGALVMKQRL